ncbi:unnamed protein product [Rodentolepis nana]|uniref:Uncharacterized protein n=1 Tax=Rodentolepis nana TaxID=102285 RepID=A0A3P7RLP6_RODNA|nr:unnamed protein product [Rodentolepis nana]
MRRWEFDDKKIEADLIIITVIINNKNFKNNSGIGYS